MKKVFLDELPKKEGIGVNKNRLVIDWDKTRGYKVKFIYDDIEGVIDIINYDKNKRKLFIKYNKNNFEISVTSFIDCRLGGLLKIITSDFKYEINTSYKDEKRDIIIIERKVKSIIKNNGNNENKKYYKYHCYKCGYEGWMIESDFLKGTGCSCCANKTIVEGINDIPTTDPWMIKYFQGGYDEAKLYISGTTKSIHPICPDCGKVKDKKVIIRNIKKYKAIGCSCSDSIPYPEKAMFNIFEQSKLNFSTQLSKITFKWCKRYKYDFYFELNNESYICEVNGLQHYEDAWNKLEKTQENDRLKKELALQNGIKEENYIVIDCRYSDLEWIRNNDNGILKSKLNELFDLSKIDWLKVEEFALSNRVKEACNYKQNNPDMTTTEIGMFMKLNRCTVQRYLAKGEKVGWCKYNIKEEKNKNHIKIGNINKQYKSKPIEIFKNEISFGIFKSGCELARLSEELLGVKMYQSMISKSCLLNTSYKGYIIKHVV